MSEREERLLAYWHTKMDQEYRLEADFLKNVKEFCETLGEECLVVREAASTKNGVADLLLCYSGKFIACELKRIGGVPSPQQLKFIERVKKAHGSAGVCRTLSDVWDLMKGYCSTTLI